MMTKKDFIEALDEIKKLREYEDKLNQLNSDYEYDYISFPTLESTCVRLLNIIFNLDENDMYGTDIEYFIYDLNFGEDWKPGMITDKDGNDVDFSTASKLYDYIINEQAN